MAQEIVLKDPASLHEHPRNQEFFLSFRAARHSGQRLGTWN